jgi:hypothetical protein
MCTAPVVVPPRASYSANSRVQEAHMHHYREQT